MFIDAIDMIRQLSLSSFIQMFWYFIIFDITRYFLSIITIVGVELLTPKNKSLPFHAPVSVILAGHNEGAVLRQCVMSLKEQTHQQLQIVMSDDGSTDNMLEVGRQLKREGLLDVVVSNSIRSGKSSAVNIGFQYCIHDIIVLVDVDTSFDRDAFESIIQPFSNPKVGAVSGNIAVRNVQDSILARFQFIEYISSISIGRRFTSMLGILSIVSGAFGAFRREAINAVGGWEVGPGEDADIIAKLRRTGWHIVFAPHAWSATDAPKSLKILIKQRLRWNRSVIRRLRKYRAAFNPFGRHFCLSNTLALMNVLFFQVILSASFYFYIVWVFWFYGSDKAGLILLTSSLFYFSESMITFLLAAWLYPEIKIIRLFPYLLGKILFVTYFLRGIRLFAYLDEIIFRRSYEASFVPSKVRKVIERF